MAIEECTRIYLILYYLNLSRLVADTWITFLGGFLWHCPPFLENTTILIIWLHCNRSSRYCRKIANVHKNTIINASRVLTNCDFIDGTASNASSYSRVFSYVLLLNLAWNHHPYKICTITVGSPWKIERFRRVSARWPRYRVWCVYTGVLLSLKWRTAWWGW